MEAGRPVSLGKYSRCEGEGGGCWGGCGEERMHLRASPEAGLVEFELTRWFDCLMWGHLRRDGRYVHREGTPQPREFSAECCGLRKAREKACLEAPGDRI